MFQTEFVEKIKTCFLFNIYFFLKIVQLCHNAEKQCTARQATDNNVAHAHCMLDN